MTRKTLVVTAVVVAVVAVSAFAALSLSAARPSVDSDVPTALVKRGDVRIEVRATGEVRAARSVFLPAPPTGASLQIITLLPTGTVVKEGDVVVDFDTAEQEFALAQAESEQRQANEELTKLQADTAVRAAQDDVEIMKARFAVRRAELDARVDSELIGAIVAQKNKLTLEEVRQRLQQIEADAQTRAKDTAASRAMLDERRARAAMTVTRAQQNIESMRITAPFDGLVIVRENQDAAGGFFFFGMTLPEFREGDTVGSGRIIAEIVDATRVEMVARVAEEERGNIAVGQPVQIRFDAEPGSTLAGDVAAIGGVNARRGFDASLRRQVDVILRVNQPPVNLRTGWTAQVTVTGDVLKGVTHVARQAVFEKEGKSVVHVRSPNGFVLTPVVVKHQTEGVVIVDGVADGAEVALADPAAAPSKAPAPAAQPRPSAPASGGRL